MSTVSRQQELNADGVETTFNVPFFKDPIKLSVSGLAVIGAIILGVYVWKKYKIAKK